MLDNVAGALFRQLIAALVDGGRYCMVGAMGGERAAFSAELFRGVAITGYSSETLDGRRWRAPARRDLRPARARRAGAARRTQALPLSRAAEAHRLIEARGVRGRILLVPDSTATAPAP